MRLKFTGHSSRSSFVRIKCNTSKLHPEVWSSLSMRNQTNKDEVKKEALFCDSLLQLFIARRALVSVELGRYDENGVSCCRCPSGLKPMRSLNGTTKNGGHP